MTYIVQISMKDKQSNQVWKDIRPSGSDKPYTFLTIDEAYSFMRKYYRLLIQETEIRIREVA